MTLRSSVELECTLLLCLGRLRCSPAIYAIYTRCTHIQSNDLNKIGFSKEMLSTGEAAQSNPNRGEMVHRARPIEKYGECVHCKILITTNYGVIQSQGYYNAVLLLSLDRMLIVGHRKHLHGLPSSRKMFYDI